MIKIIGKRVIDLIAYQQGILFVLKEPSADGQIKTSFYSFDIKTQSIATVTKNAYLMTKFGQGFNAIVAHLDDYISCEAQRIADGRTFVIFSDGQIGVFSDSGVLLHTDIIRYNNAPVRSLAYDGEHFWFAVPDANAVVRYNTKKYRIDMRLGDTEAAVFNRPVSVSKSGNSLFVCCKNTNSVAELSLKDYSIINNQTFNEAVLQYLKIEDGECVVLQSGVYLL